MRWLRPMIVGSLVFERFGIRSGEAVALALLWTASATLWALAGGAIFTLPRPLFGEQARPA
jgi:hypothetical protein